MSQQVRQIRYFGTGSAQNTPGISINNLITGNGLVETNPLCSLGIRALPGTKFFLNNSEDPIIISHLGIFELDFQDGGSITHLKFDEESVRRIDQIRSQGYIIIDMLEKGVTE